MTYNEKCDAYGDYMASIEIALKVFAHIVMVRMKADRLQPDELTVEYFREWLKTQPLFTDEVCAGPYIEDMIKAEEGTKQ